MAAELQIISFDDIILDEGAEARIPDGYAGFHWLQAGVYNPDGSLGYTAGSGQNLAFIAEANGNEVGGYEDAAAGTPFVMTRAQPFDLVSADFSAAFRDGLVITITAYADEAGTIPLGSTTITVDRGSSQGFDFDEAVFGGARRIEFNANDGNASTSDYFGIDNLAVRDTAPTVLDFDSIALAPGGETPLFDTFEGFDVSGIGVYNPDGAIPGYRASSGSNIGFIAEANGNEIGGYDDHQAGAPAVFVRDTPFTFTSGVFSAAFRDDLDLTVTAYADAAGTIVIGTAHVQIDQGTQLVTFVSGGNVVGTFDNALRLEFTANDGNPLTSDYFGFDDLTFYL